MAPVKFLTPFRHTVDIGNCLTEPRFTNNTTLQKSS